MRFALPLVEPTAELVRYLVKASRSYIDSAGVNGELPAALASPKEKSIKLRKSLMVAMCAVSLGGISVPMTASAEVAIYLNSPPPPARYEVVPAPRNGYVWVPGYWNARHNKHVWQAGHWERERHGYHYNQPSWVQHDNRWELQRGGWSKGDRDGDGVPNKVDRAPNDPTRG